MMIATLLTFALMPQGKLTIGDTAPPLIYASTVSGTPTKSLGGRVAVVEFWATWCAPCVEQMPHLSDLFDRYRSEVDFVSVSVMEDDQAKVAPFIKKQGARVRYPVVTDRIESNGKGLMYTRWLEAAVQKAIPIAFVIDKSGKIAWIGSPLDLEPVIKSVLAETWNPLTFKGSFEGIRSDEESASKLLAEGFGTIAGTPRRGDFANTIRWIEQGRSKYPGSETQASLDFFVNVFRSLKAGEFEAALEMSRKEPTNGLVWTYFRPMLAVVRLRALQHLGPPAVWRKEATQMIEGPPDPNLLMGLVDALALPESTLEKDADLALQAANKLVLLARAPMFLLRLAWAQHAKGLQHEALKVLDEASGLMDEEKRRNPGYYDEFMRQIAEAREAIGKGTTSAPST